MADGNSTKSGKGVSSGTVTNTGADPRGFTTYPNQANGPTPAATSSTATSAAAPPAAASTPTAAPNTAPPPAASTPTQAIVVPVRSMRPLVVGAGALAAGSALVYAVHRWRQGSLAAADKAASLPGASPNGATDNGTPAPPAGAGQTPAPPAGGGQTPAPPAGTPANYWGTGGRGEQYRALFTKIEEVTGMPLRLYLCVVANCEASWVRTARNKSVVEVAASRRGIDNGTERGNPRPKYADSIREAGSGGLFGALSPYVAWTGHDEGFMPYLDEDWKIIEDPIVAVICAAKYYQRIVGGGRYPVHANPAAPAPTDNYRVRLGWARPATLKDDPTGKLAQAVQKRFDEDLVELGLKITDLPPPNADKWPGLKAVVEAMKGFPVTWK